MIISEGPFLTVIVPIYNEAPRIGQNLRTISAYTRLRWPDSEIIAVDDGSSDNTAEVIEGLEKELPGLRSICYTPNRGKGFASRTGMSHARGQWVALVDADLEVPIEDLESLFQVQRATGADVVIGSKRHPGSRVTYPLVRRFLSRGYNAIVRLSFGIDISDTQCGFKLFRRGPVDRLVGPLLVKRFVFDVELLVVSQRSRLRIEEAPIVLNFGRQGSGRINVKSIVNMLLETAGVWFRLYVTRYYDRAGPDASAAAHVTTHPESP